MKMMIKNKQCFCPGFTNQAVENEAGDRHSKILLHDKFININSRAGIQPTVSSTDGEYRRILPLKDRLPGDFVQHTISTINKKSKTQL